MSTSRRQQLAAIPQRRMFKRRPRLPAIVVVRQLLAIVLMLSGSVGIIIAIQQLPEQIDVVLLVSEAVADLIRGVQQLLEALLGFAAVVLIAALVLLATLLLFGSVLRVFRLIRLMLRGSTATSLYAAEQARPIQGRR